MMTEPSEAKTIPYIPSQRGEGTDPDLSRQEHI